MAFLLNTSNTTLHTGTTPALPGPQDYEAAGAALRHLRRPLPVQHSQQSPATRKGGWTFGTDQQATETVNCEDDRPDPAEGEWITRFTIDTDVAPQTNATIFFYGTVIPPCRRRSADFASFLPPERYYGVASRIDALQNCASGTLTNGTPAPSSPRATGSLLDARARRVPRRPGLQVVRTNPVVVGKPTSFFINGAAKRSPGWHAHSVHDREASLPGLRRGRCLHDCSREASTLEAAHEKRTKTRCA